MMQFPNYKINAKVIDIANDSPLKSDRFLVDTNVWLWMSYSNLQYVDNGPEHYQTEYYPNYLSQAMCIKAKLIKCELSFAEIAYRIENVERNLYEQSQAQKIDTKAYRYNYQKLRNDMLEELQGVMYSVNSMSEPLSVTIDDNSTSLSIGQLRTWLVDAYDLFIIQTMKQNSITQIITDDGDFSTVSGLLVFTANRNVITAAKSQGKLLNR